MRPSAILRNSAQNQNPHHIIMSKKLVETFLTGKGSNEMRFSGRILTLKPVSQSLQEESGLYLKNVSINPARISKSLRDLKREVLAIFVYAKRYRLDRSSSLISNPSVKLMVLEEKRSLIRGDSNCPQAAEQTQEEDLDQYFQGK